MVMIERDELSAHVSHANMSQKLFYRAPREHFPRKSCLIPSIAVMVLIILMILKYVTDLSDESGDHQEDVRAATESETNPLCSEKAIPLTYGTWEEDVETGSSSSGEDLYDGRICVICYNEQRNCFFVPFGHCATCYDCAQRIISNLSVWVEQNLSRVQIFRI